MTKIEPSQAMYTAVDDILLSAERINRYLPEKSQISPVVAIVAAILSEVNSQLDAARGRQEMVLDVSREAGAYLASVGELQQERPTEVRSDLIDMAQQIRAGGETKRTRRTKATIEATAAECTCVGVSDADKRKPIERHQAECAARHPAPAEFQPKAGEQGDGIEPGSGVAEETSSAPLPGTSDPFAIMLNAPTETAPAGKPDPFRVG